MIGLPLRDPSLQDERFEAFQLAIARRYRIERELGHGGMATVYLTQDLKHGRAVALKLLRPEIAAVLGIDRFLREIQVSARLSHPNILPFYDSDEAAGLLFYVMPYVESGTLHDRLQRGPRPSVAEALDLTRQVAAGLGYAHEEGVIHRDIKPANLLIASGHVFISDFGIARMVRQAVTTEGMTEAGFAIGTPDYMAPEQSRGTSQVDGRADEYSLAAVLFEMLVGQPPSHAGGTAAKVRRGLRAARPDLPSVIETALIRALSNDCDGRFKTVAEFAAALEGAMVPVEVRRRPSRLRSMVLTAGAAAVVAGVWLFVKHQEKPVVPAIQADTTRYVIFPFDDPSGAGAALDESDRLHDALMRWSGLSVIDPRDVAEQIAKLGARHPSSTEAVDIARRLNAGRYIRGEVSRLGDSLRLHATIYDVNAGQLKDYTVRIPSDLGSAESRFATLTDQLLFRGLGAGAVALTGSRSLPALQAFARGQAAILDWSLPAADSAYGAAVHFDPQFAEGLLWLALVRMWNDEPIARWNYLAQQAGAARLRLSHREQSISDALLAQGRGELGTACPSWQNLATRLQTDFVAWYAAAICLGKDTLVLPDPRSPSRYRFRSSRRAALEAYRKAFELRPAVLTSFRSGGYASARELFHTHRSVLRYGRAAPPDTMRFLSYASWEGDTLGFVPYPSARIRQADPTVRPKTVELAVRHQREEFHEVALTWVTAFPNSPAAIEALAVSLELLGSRAALDTITRARVVAARTPRESARLAATEVWMRVQFAIPDDTTSLRRAVEIADSFLTPEMVARAPEAEPLLGMAVLTGRATLAARLSRRTAREVDWDLPDPIINDAPALLTFSSLGGPEDSLTRLEAVVARAIDRLEPASARPAIGVEWLGRAAAIAFPDHRASDLSRFEGVGYRLLAAELSFTRGDTAAVRLALDAMTRGRAGIAPGDLSLDALYPEAWLLAAIGDRRSAAERLDPTLNDLATTGPNVFTDPPRAGALVRAMALRARLAEQEGDLAQARRWALPVTVLWRNADGFLQPTVERMRRIVLNRN